MKGLRLLRPQSKVVLAYPGCLLMESGRKASRCGFLRKLHLIIASYQLRVNILGKAISSHSSQEQYALKTGTGLDGVPSL